MLDFSISRRTLLSALAASGLPLSHVAQAVAAAETLTAEPSSEAFQLQRLFRGSLMLARRGGVGVIRLGLRRLMQQFRGPAFRAADAEQQITQKAQNGQKEHGGRPAEGRTRVPLGQQGMYDAEPGKRMGKQQPDCLKIRKNVHACFSCLREARPDVLPRGLFISGGSLISFPMSLSVWHAARFKPYGLSFRGKSVFFARFGLAALCVSRFT